MTFNPAQAVDLAGMDILCRTVQTSSSTTGGTGFKFLGGNGTTPSSVTTTTSTYTAANMLAGVIVNSNAGAVTATLDTATNIIAAINAVSSGANVGDIISFELINGGSTSGTITVGAGTGGTFDANVPAANKAVGINLAKTVFVRITNVTTPAYVIYM